MCNIAGYVGTKDATPILLEMIRVQEGINGGFYTGLAVHDGENLHFRKLRGDLEKLLQETDAEKLTGCCGMIHSRTPSGGPDLWAHPFHSEENGEVQLCYVANGGIGRFKPRKESYNAVADKLVAQGYDIPCKIQSGLDKYNKLSSGECVHISDVVCQLIYKYKKCGADTAAAMTEAFTRMPSEVVGLVIEKESPDRIYFSRINMPMFVGFDETGDYLVSAPTGFPAHIKEFKLLPALSSGVIYRDRYEVVKYPHFSEKVRGFNRKSIERTMRIIQELLAEGEKDFVDIRIAVAKGLPTDKLLQVPPMTYLALYELQQSGAIVTRQTTKTVAGQTAPTTRFSLA